MDQAEREIEDQGEWERCRSLSRMFLALTDSGGQKDIQKVALKLLDLIGSHGLASAHARQAQFYWENGMLEAPRRGRKPKELADRSYLVMHFTSMALDELPSMRVPGEAFVCEVIRRIHPLAPNGFRKVGKLEKANASGYEALIYKIPNL